MDCIPPDSSVRGDSPGKNTEVSTHTFSRGSSPPRDQISVFYVSCIVSWVLYHQSHLGSLELKINYT